MGFNKGCLILDSENGVFFAGQTISGRLEFDQRKDKNIHGIYISVKGYCKVHWTSQRSRSVNDRREIYTVHHDSYEEYIHQKIYVFGKENGEHHLNPGHHEYDFSFHLPANCPSSFEGSYGHIRYRVKALMNTSGFLSSNKEKFEDITVVALTDLNTIPYCKDPIEYEILQSYCCWCMNAGSSELTVRLPVGGYCPGQVIPMEVSCRNNSSIDMDEITFTIEKEITFHAAYEPGTQSDEDTVAQVTKGPVPANSTKTWTVEMTVPHMDVYNVDACKYIDISYNFKVSTEVSGCHSGEEETRQIIFGTVPLVGYDIQCEPADQVPQQIQGVTNTYPPAPIINQPLPTATYPNANTPYPHPYPNANIPYPTPAITVAPPYANSPANPNSYAPTNLPYPGNASFPPGDSPHQSPYLPRNPNSVPPYLNNTTPQITSTSPNVTTYPIENVTHSTSSVPNPGPVPYPNHPSPVPPYPSGTPGQIKTGTMGFIVGGEDSAKLPLLPPGGNIPYPQTPANPYINASAPEPSTPDSIDKESADPLAPKTQS